MLPPRFSSWMGRTLSEPSRRVKPVAGLPRPLAPGPPPESTPPLIAAVR